MGLTMFMFLTAIIYVVNIVKNDIIQAVCVRGKLPVPSKPGRLALIDLGRDYVVLSWSVPEMPGLHPIRYYVLAYRDTHTLTRVFLKNPRPDTGSQNPWLVAKRLSPTTLAAKYGDLKPGHVYEFKVFACSNSGIGDASNIFVPIPRDGDPLTEEKIDSYKYYLMEVMDKGAGILKEVIKYPVNMWH